MLIAHAHWIGTVLGLCVPHGWLDRRRIVECQQLTLEYQQSIVKIHEICIFDALKVQAMSDLTRKRSVHCNPPPKGKRRARGDSGKGPKSITASQRSRVKELPEECLAVTVRGNRSYFARPFARNLASIRTVSHVSSTKHKTRNCLFCTMPYSWVF